MSPPGSPAPVLAGAAAVVQREDDPRRALEAIDLLEAAVVAAADDALAGEGGSSRRLLERAGLVLVPHGLWSYGDPGGRLRERVLPGARSVLAEFGVLQQSLWRRACTAIATGEAEVVVVCGAEAKHRARRAELAGLVATELDQGAAAPDERLVPAAELRSPVEVERGLSAPVAQYAVMESALRARLGRTVAAHRAAVAELWAGFSEVAAANPDAWHRTSVTAEFLAEASDANPMLATPYTRWHCSQWNVDQAAALVFTSAAVAARLGLDAVRLVHPLAAVESNAMVNLSSRAEPGTCPAVAVVGERLAELAGVEAAEADLVELYSCFPAAVELQAAALGLGDGRPLTVTGGMTFAGGPVNNASLQALVALVGRLRAEPGAVGLISSVSGMLTKHGCSLFAAGEPIGPFVSAEVGDEALAATPVVEVVPGERGRGTVAGFTVLHDHGRPVRAVVLADVAGGRRAVASSAEPELVAAMATEEWVGRDVELDGAELAPVAS